MKRLILLMTVEEMKADSKKELDKKQIHYITTALFNPKITVMKGKQYFYEGCMSVGNTIGKVYRPYYIEYDAQDIYGNPLHKSAPGFEAITTCHEIDHLDGIEFIVKASDVHYNADLEKRLEIRKKYPHKIISKTGDFTQDDVKQEYRTKIYTKKK